MQDIVANAKELVELYDVYSNRLLDSEKLLNIEEKLNKLKQDVLREDDEEENMVPGFYPSIMEKSFNRKIALKKEFAKSKYSKVEKVGDKYDELVKQYCNRGNRFQLTANQIFLKNFLSPKTPYNSVLLFHGVGVGKCHAVDTPILMFDGSLKMVQDICVGDLLMGDDGTPRTVLSLGSGYDDMFEIKPDFGGEKFVVNSEHILCLKYTGKVLHSSIEGFYLSLPCKDDLSKNDIIYFSSRKDVDLYLEHIQKTPIIYEISVKDFITYNLNIRNQFSLYHVVLDFESKDAQDDALEQGKQYVSNDHSHAEVRNKYILAPFKVRHAFFNGIVDYLANDRTLVLPTKNHAHNIALLVRMLGYLCDCTCQNDQFIVRLYISEKLETPFSIEKKSWNKYYGFTLDSNHRYLLSDLTVTHNTCTSLTIAESFRQHFGNKTIVILPTNLKDSFKRQICDVSKLDKRFSGDNQCVASKYLKQIPERDILGKDMVEKKINKLIHENYQFYGFLEFANIIKKIKDNINQVEKNENIAKYKIKQELRQWISNRVIIIDEVHNTRADGVETQKIVPPLLREVLQAGNNVKLVLCSATPMYNDASEIVWIVNLLLANEKQPLLKDSDLFDSKGVFTTAGKAKLESATRGMVSYMKGENPFSFPQRLYPSINGDPKLLKQPPQVDIYGQQIPKDEQIHDFQIIASKMDIKQTTKYTSLKKPLNSEDNEIVDMDDNSNTHLSQYIQISNITYPGSEPIGRKGFDECFERTPNSKILRVKYKPDILKTYGQFLDRDNLAKYSAKIRTIVDYIKNAKGVVFIYSFYIWSALIPLAIALEHEGFQKHGEKNILERNDATPLMIDGHRATYTILAKESSICHDVQKEVAAITSASNIHGHKVKVILGTSVSAEGIDFKCVREVHLLEPWYHLNKVEQVVGRAIRTCSHTALPKEERNVTIYQHAAVPNNYDQNLQESIDLRIYRLAKKKQVTINQVENILKANSIDCLFNNNIYHFDPQVLDIRITLRTSQGKQIDNFLIGNLNKANEIKCIANIDSKDLGTDTSTFDHSYYQYSMMIYTDAVAGLFKSFEQAWSYEEILNKIKKKINNVEEDALKVALQNMLDTQMLVQNQHQLEGTLQYTGDRYQLLPRNYPFTYITHSNRKDYKPIVSRRILITDAQDVPQDVEFDDTDWDNEIYERVDKILKSLKNKTINEKKYRRAVISYVIDRLVQKDLDNLVLYAVVEDDKNIQGYLTSAGILIKMSDKVIYRSPHRANKLFVVKVRDDQYSISDIINTPTLNRDFTLQQPQIDTFVNNLKDALQKYEGYAEVKDGVTSFKLLTGKANSVGCVCAQTSTILVPKLTKWIKDLDPSMVILPEYKKVHLCQVYEIAMRQGGNFLRPVGVTILKAKIGKK
jgi:hypothetical protein